ncbi:MAG: hypothetical protein IMY72_01485 [Bacteroidetes bacterium]|nr:hypothetical protein [Bacteroidota bacterium]
MLFENKQKASKTKFCFRLMLFIYLLLLVGSLLVDFVEGYSFIAILTAVFVCVFVIITHLHFFYFSFDVEEDKLVFKFSSLSLIIGSNKTIKIQHALFVKFKIKTTFFGYKKELILYQKLKGGVAKYPPISISLLNGKEIDEMSKMLNSALINK